MAIFAVGGCEAGGSVTGKVERYDLATNTWVVCAPMLTPRHSFELLVLAGRLYAFGGIGGDQQAEAKRVATLIDHPIINKTAIKLSSVEVEQLTFTTWPATVGSSRGSSPSTG